MNASEDLRKEHDAILFALNILEKMAAAARKGESVDRKDAVSMTDFLKIFADKCHHGKEEGFLFPEYERSGIVRNGGPIGVMLKEHDEGRAFIGAMSGALRADPMDGQAYAAASQGYIDLLRRHIEKENSVLFPAGDARLTAAAHENLLAKFEEFEEEVIGSGKHEELHALLDYFAKKYA